MRGHGMVFVPLLTSLSIVCSCPPLACNSRDVPFHHDRACVCLFSYFCYVLLMENVENVPLLVGVSHEEVVPCGDAARARLCALRRGFHYVLSHAVGCNPLLAHA